jgi:hypothetical protein
MTRENQTGETGARCGQARKSRTAQLKTCSSKTHL